MGFRNQCTNDDDEKTHLKYRVHSAYEEIQKKLEELQAAKEERAKKKAEVNTEERKKRDVVGNDSGRSSKHDRSRSRDKRGRDRSRDRGDGIKKVTQKDLDRWDGIRCS